MQADRVAVIPLREDDEDVQTTLTALTDTGAEVYRVPGEPPSLTEPSAFSMVVVHSPGLTLELLDVLRATSRADVPTIAAVEQLTEEEELILLHSGAWDVISLPTSERRLRTRLQAFHQHFTSRRANGSSPEVYHVENVTIDLRRREVRVGDVALDLTKTEFDLLVALAREPHAVLSRDELFASTGIDGHLGRRSLESHLSRLRLKIQNAGGPRLVDAVRGVGYRLHG